MSTEPDMKADLDATLSKYVNADKLKTVLESAEGKWAKWRQALTAEGADSEAGQTRAGALSEIGDVKDNMESLSGGADIKAISNYLEGFGDGSSASQEQTEELVRLVSQAQTKRIFERLGKHKLPASEWGDETDTGKGGSQALSKGTEGGQSSGDVKGSDRGSIGSPGEARSAKHALSDSCAETVEGPKSKSKACKNVFEVDMDMEPRDEDLYL